MTPLQLCKCLADDTRLRTVALLSLYEELCVCDLVSVLSLPQPTVSRHLAQLRDCGLLNVRRDAQWSYYRLAADLPDWASEAIQVLSAPFLKANPGWARSAAACC